MSDRVLSAARPSTTPSGQLTPNVTPWLAAGWVVAYWWVATGVMFVLQRNVGTRLVALGLSVGSLVYGLRLLRASRDDASPRGQLRGAMAGALAWAAVVGLFFEGWVVGPDATRLGSETRGWPGAFAAIVATSSWEACALVALIALGALVRRRPNQLALWTFFVFWCAHQTAKLNLFFGVENPGTEVFPFYLAHLGRYVGPNANSPLLPVTIVAYLAIAGVCLWRARQVRHGLQVGLVVLATLSGLAALEHAMLSTRLPLDMWAWFLRVGRA